MNSDGIHKSDHGHIPDVQNCLEIWQKKKYDTCANWICIEMPNRSVKSARVNFTFGTRRYLIFCNTNFAFAEIPFIIWFMRDIQIPISLPSSSNKAAAAAASNKKRTCIDSFVCSLVSTIKIEIIITKPMCGAFSFSLFTALGATATNMIWHIKRKKNWNYSVLKTYLCNNCHVVSSFCFHFYVAWVSRLGINMRNHLNGGTWTHAYMSARTKR